MNRKGPDEQVETSPGGPTQGRQYWLRPRPAATWTQKTNNTNQDKTNLAPGP